MLRNDKELERSNGTSCPHEEMLVGCARKGDHEAFGSLVEVYWTSIQRYLLRLTGEAELAADLTQETFYKAFLGIERLPNHSSLQFRPWLYKIATNLAISASQRKRKKGWLSLDWLSSESKIPAYILCSEQPDLLDQTLVAEDSRQVVAILNQLPKEQVAVLLLRFYHELGYDEIGQILNIQAEAVRARVHRARAAFGRVYTKSTTEDKKQEDKNER